MKYSAYPQYKDSGIVWLGKVPEHWEVRRLKFAVILTNEKVGAQKSELPYMGLEHIESWTGRRVVDEEASSDGIGSHFLPKDVLFGKLRPYLAKVFLAQHEGIATTEALVLRPEKEISSCFLKYYLLSRDFINIVDSSTYGAKMPRANWDFIGNLLSLVPLYEEQKNITDFLDKKTAQIDTLIEKKKALIEKLNEKRIALITKAVTKGLDDSVPLKDSGVKWLGKVPEHWEVERLYDISQIKTSTVDKKTVEGQETVRLCNYVDVYNNDNITVNIEFMTASASKDEIKKFRLEKDDVVITKDSENPFDIGIPAFINENIENLVCGYHLSIIYVGSAKKNLGKRTERHKKLRKKFFWHIDYLRAHAKFITALPIRTKDSLECSIAHDMKKIAKEIPGFGCSDCSCFSHLFMMRVNPLHTREFHNLVEYYRMERLIER